MFKTPAVITDARRMLKLVDGAWWVVPGIILLNVPTFLSENFGIYLLIPLISIMMAEQNVEGAPSIGDGNVVVRILSDITACFEGPNQVAIILGLIALCIFLRGVLLVSNTAVARRETPAAP